VSGPVEVDPAALADLRNAVGALVLEAENVRYGAEGALPALLECVEMTYRRTVELAPPLPALVVISPETIEREP
jgi:hypothetical protein